MSKLLGAACILAGGLWLRQLRMEEQRRPLYLLEGVLSALVRMEAEIRTRRPSMPELLHTLEAAQPAAVGHFFQSLCAAIQRGQFSRDVWQTEVQSLSLPDGCRAALDKLGPAFQEDEASLHRCLETAIRELTREQLQLADRQQADGHRISVCTLSGTLLLLILLI